MKNQVLIAPSVLGADFLDLGNEIRAITDGGADYIHFDVMDGRFVPEISFGELLLRQMKQAAELPVDVHLMVEEPEKHIDSFIRAGADRITVHLESTDQVPEILERLKNAGTDPGISINPETPVEAVFPYLDRLGSVLIMTVHPGFGGQHFIEASLDRIRALRKEISRRSLAVRIAVDGGINMDTAVSAKEAGADFFVCGTFVFRNDRVANIRALRAVL